MKKPQSGHDPTITTKVDWGEIRSRVNASRESLDHKALMSPETRSSTLKARAKALALERNNESAQKEMIEIIEFRLGSETYGIENVFIREVYPLKDFTPLPGTPTFVLGIINVRGQIVSVIDLKQFLHLPEKGLGEMNQVIIIHNERMEFGILADSIQGTRSVSHDVIHTQPASTGEIGAGYLRGVTNDHIIILDAENILKDEHIIVHQEAG